nr:twin-arginine translocation signal domain-containing protein [Microthrixaceae bacterium]
MAVTRADNPRVNARSRPVPLSAAGSSRVATSPSERGRGRGAMSRRSFLGGGAAMAAGMLSS